MNLEDLLSVLKDQCVKRPVDGVGILRALEGVLAWLVLPENNTDANCDRVDWFVTLEMRDILDLDTAGEAGRMLDCVMGLHDTHSYPEIAENFQAKPDQLLAQTRETLAKLTA
jgi:hypothetical protein